MFYTRSYIGKEKLDARVMQAMGKVSRETFVPDVMQYAAFDNGPLPIGNGQTISQPYRIVALMTDMLALQPEDCVLEIGTGSGYQTAVLSLLCKQVYSMERIAELGYAASQRLQKLGYKNIEAKIGNGYEGWPEHGGRRADRDARHRQIQEGFHRVHASSLGRGESPACPQ